MLVLTLRSERQNNEVRQCLRALRQSGNHRKPPLSPDPDFKPIRVSQEPNIDGRDDRRPGVRRK